MPAKSVAQRRLMGACSHGADYDSCPKGMSHEKMREYASTPERDLPKRKMMKKRKMRSYR